MNKKYETLQHQIRYHKDINAKKAKQLFNDAFEDYVTQIITPSGVVYERNGGDINIRKVVEATEFINKFKI